MTTAVSIEPIHLYGHDLSPDRISTELRGAVPIIGALLRSLPTHVIPRVCFLIDNHSNQRDSAECDDQVGSLLDVWHECVNTDQSLEALRGQDPFVALETKLVDFAKLLWPHIARSPIDGDGSSGVYRSRSVPEGDVGGDFLTNYVRFPSQVEGDPYGNYLRFASGKLQMDVEIGLRSSGLLDLSDMTRHSGIGLVCSLLDEKDEDEKRKFMPSCSLLAATWQLYRLGYFSEEHEFSLMVSGDDGPQSPRSNTAPADQPGVSDRTFTILSPSYIAVEHAVRLILHHVVFGPGTHSASSNSATEAVEDVLSRIAYMFLPSSWYGVSKS